MKQDETLIATLSEKDPEFKALVEGHRDLDKQLDDLNSRHYLSDDDQVLKKQIQKEKLLRKDKIEAILAKHR